MIIEFPTGTQQTGRLTCGFAVMVIKEESRYANSSYRASSASIVYTVNTSKHYMGAKIVFLFSCPFARCQATSIQGCFCLAKVHFESFTLAPEAR